MWQKTRDAPDEFYFVLLVILYPPLRPIICFFERERLPPGFNKME